MTGRIRLFAALFLIAACAPLAARPLYWEHPRQLSPKGAVCRFPSAVSAPDGSGATVFWEDVDAAKNRIHLSAAHTKNGFDWTYTTRFAGPIIYSGDIPNVYSAAVNQDGTIALATFTSPTEIAIYVSKDGMTFSKAHTLSRDDQLVAPRLYATRNGSFMLFVSLADSNTLSLLQATSEDGTSWTKLEPFTPSKNANNPMVPFLSPLPDGDLVVYQAYNITHSANGELNVFQLYATVSKDNGKTWSKSVLVTGEDSLPKADTGQWNMYINQQPCVLADDDGIYLAWERRSYGAISSHIWFAKLLQNGSIDGNAEQLTEAGNAGHPVLFTDDGKLMLLWFDTRNGNGQIFLKQRQGKLWGIDDERPLSSERGAASFASPFRAQGGETLGIIWQNGTQADSRTSISVLEPDHSAAAPTVQKSSVKAGAASSVTRPQVTLRLAPDSSGVAGFSYCWSMNKDDFPSHEAEALHMPFEAEKPIAVELESNGLWYFKACQLDNAGNWSAASGFSYTLDTVPPRAPLLSRPATDTDGFCATNSLAISWRHDPSDTDVESYRWSLSFIDSIPVPEQLHAATLQPQSAEARQGMNGLIERYRREKERGKLKTTTVQSGTTWRAGASFSNLKNGLYQLTVVAVDRAGNAGPQARFDLPLVLNKYRASTYVSSVSSLQDDYNRSHVSIKGVGFAYDGTITKIYLDRDGLVPYDRELKLSDHAFKVESDSLISGLVVDDLPEGTYRIGLLHSGRGLYFTPEGSPSTSVIVTQGGTVKIQRPWQFTPEWIPLVATSARKVNITALTGSLVFLLAIIGLAISMHGIAKTAHEASIIHREVTGLLTGGTMPQKRNIIALKKKSRSLKYKLLGFSLFLVISIIVMVTLPLSVYMQRTQQRTLSQNLYTRVKVVMGSLATSARTYLPPTPDTTELMLLPVQADEALGTDSLYTTVTGWNENGTDTSFDYVWTSSDPEIQLEQTYGNSRLGAIKTDEDAEAVQELLERFTQERIAERVRKELSKLDSRLEASPVHNEHERDAQIRNETERILNDISESLSGSFPEYNTNAVDLKNNTYLFYKPVLKRPASNERQNLYLRGMILVKVNTDSLISSMNRAYIDIGLITLIVIAIAFFIGIIGSVTLANLIIRPIKRLVSHVAMIRDTEDKETLSGKSISITTNDEIALLGDTVNEMTQALAQAAIASKNLTIGKEVQTKFLPLETDQNGNTLTTSHLKAEGADFFSYYAGADELSGDYFDYKQIDRTHYVIIKCDISGHGVPAALIMVEVATLFLNYFRNWDMKKASQGYNLAPVVGQINDLLESRSFKGRFAAFTLCLLDTEQGTCWFCNAGDNLVQLYDSTAHAKKTVTLPETPAAGMFSTDLIDMRGGYKVSKLTLKKDDVLFLYTDGIEEAKRLFRAQDGSPTLCAMPGLATGDMHENHRVGDESEELGAERVKDIIETVFAQGRYTLKKHHHDKAERLEFDFSTCPPDAEHAVMALVSVEKVFRMYKPAGKTGSSTKLRVKVDKKIDEFLSRHFLQYAEWSGTKTGAEPGFLWYWNVQEDPQYDDLTLIAIKKN